jgi:hypothetical protein
MYSKESSLENELERSMSLSYFLESGDTSFKVDDNLIEENFYEDDVFSGKIEKDSDIIEPKRNTNEEVKEIKSKLITRFSTENKIFNITKTPKKSKKRLGRKTKSESSTSSTEGHTKYAKDNMTRKLKPILIDALTNTTNNSLKEESLEIPNYSKIYLLKTDSSIKYKIKADFNRKLLSTPLKDIFYCNIFGRCKNYSKDHNKIAIEKIYSQKEETKTKAILERTFQDCLEHFRGTKYFPELKGLEDEYNKLFIQMEGDGEEKKYINDFKDFINNFEIYYNNKKSRQRNKSNIALMS